MNDLVDQYKSLLEEYRIVKEGDIGLCYNIRQKATTLRSNYGELMCSYEKEMIDAKNTASGIKAQKSINHSPTKVTEGNRHAEANIEYQDALKLYSLKLKQFKYTEVQYNILKDIAYHMNSQWEIMNKQTTFYKRENK
jgi:hypothetical protein